MRIFQKVKRKFGFAWLVLALSCAAGPTTACRLALTLALDVSGSVDQSEYRLQLNGLAEALSDPDVSAALFAMPGAPVAVSVFEWSSSEYQRVIQPWVLLEAPGALADVVARLRGWQREAAPQATGLGAAMRYANGMLSAAPSCWKSTLDISGDGKNNDWPEPEDLRAGGALGHMGINALVIADNTHNRGVEAEELAAYFRARVIQGPDAFVEVALGFSDYARAMRRKLLKELETLPVGNLQERFPVLAHQ